MKFKSFPKEFIHEMTQFLQLTTCRTFPTNCWANKNCVGGLDVGTSKVGVAISDDYQMNAVPLCILKREFKNGPLKREDLHNLSQIVQRHNLKGFVVGCNNLHSNDSLHFAERDEMLDSFLSSIDYEEIAAFQQILLWDEYYSSVIAADQQEEPFRQAVLSKNRFGKVYKFKSRNTNETFIDDKAAAVILNEYLGCVNRKFFS